MSRKSFIELIKVSFTLAAPWLIAFAVIITMVWMSMTAI
jgi:hypothetical protein